MTTRDVTRERGSRGMLDGTRATSTPAQTMTLAPRFPGNFFRVSSHVHLKYILVKKKNI